jgi:hypothetical protein
MHEDHQLLTVAQRGERLVIGDLKVSKKANPNPNPNPITLS